MCSWHQVCFLHSTEIRVSDAVIDTVLKQKPSCSVPVANDNAPEHALRPGFLSTFALATDQGSKLGLSKNKSIICYYNTYQVSDSSLRPELLMHCLEHNGREHDVNSASFPLGSSLCFICQFKLAKLHSCALLNSYMFLKTEAGRVFRAAGNQAPAGGAVDEVFRICCEGFMFFLQRVFVYYWHS